MAVETRNMKVSHERYLTRNLGGNYADMGRAMGGYTERVKNPEEISSGWEIVLKLSPYT